MFAWAALAATGCAAVVSPAVPTPLERSGYTQLGSSAEIAGFLGQLAATSPTHAALVTIGHSALGQPLHALLLSRDLAALRDGHPAPDRLVAMVIGSQHGMEPSGTEAILRLAREVVAAPSAALEGMDLVLIPNSNPDGHDTGKRVNGHGVNLSTNFTTLSEPEAQAIVGALERWQPSVVLDVHESAVFKRSTLGAQGYLTDVEAQFELANNPNVDAGLAAFGRQRLLPDVLALVNAQGLPAQHYFGEITDIAQPITHGGLTLKNLRNAAAMRGSVSFLVENRLDPKAGTYPTWRNIGARVSKQSLSISAYLAACRAHRVEILRLTEQARVAWQSPPAGEEVSLFAAYAPDPIQPRVMIRLRRVDGGESVQREFDYHGAVDARHALVLPRAYAVTANQAVLRSVLDRQGIRYTETSAPTTAAVLTQRIEARSVVPARHGWSHADYRIDVRRQELALPPGTLWIPLDQPARRRIALLLEPLSNSSLFEDPAYSGLVRIGEDFFIQRIDG